MARRALLKLGSLAGVHLGVVGPAFVIWHVVGAQATMSAVNVTNVAVLDNPSMFLNPFQFEISYECLVPLKDGESSPLRPDAVEVVCVFLPSFTVPHSVSSNGQQVEFILLQSF